MQKNVHETPGSENTENPFEYKEISVSITGNPPSYTFEPDNLNKFSLNKKQIATLRTNGFVLVPGHYKQFYELYKNCKERGTPVFVTTDCVLHTFHILYDYTLRMLETEHFVKDLFILTKTMRDTSLSYYEKTGDNAALKNVAYFCVAGKLLDDTFTIPPEVDKIVQKELDLICGHRGFSNSPIFGYKEDYSQYVPRGHYTRSDSLKKYFKAMMWYGRIMFRLKSEEETKQALYIVAAINDTGSLELWNKIYEPTVFFVGKTDDLTIVDYETLATKVYTTVTITALKSTQKLQQFIEEAKKLQDPQIMSGWVKDTDNATEETKGFRFMGQRFIPDSYMFQQLVYDKVGTQKKPRFHPKGLDIMAVLGSEKALHYLESEMQYLNYGTQMDMLKKEVSQLGNQVWTQNLYWMWLYVLQPLLQEKSLQYPAFMQSDAWTDKSLCTALGSWTELRHDTILYAKQSYTFKLTAMPVPPSVTKGYVEPNPYLYARLASLTRMMKEGLTSLKLLRPEYGRKLDILENLLVQLKTISEKELSGKDITSNEYHTISDIGSVLESLVTFRTATTSQADKNVAVVADVHTDVNTQTVLEEGVGSVFSVYVVVPLEGRPVVTEGGVFSYYEFLQPLDNRLTDEQWQTMEKPPLPAWTQSFIVSP